MNETIFTKIINGNIPCHKIYEDEWVFAFLDINPLSFGHTLLIPKEPVAFLHELSETSAAALGRVLPKLCEAIVKVTQCENYNVLQNNGALAHQAVPHVHFHIIPKPTTKEGLGVGWPATQLDKAAGTKLAADISKLL